MLTLFGCGQTRSMRPLWALKESNLPYEYIEVNLKEGAHKSEDFAKLNPNKTIPVLKDGDFVLFESGAILTYIGDLVPEKGLVPQEDPKKRAIYHQWMDFINCELDANLFTIEKHSWRYPEEARSEKVIQSTIQDMQKPLAVLTTQLEKSPFLLGDEFSFADIMLAHCLNWARYRQVFKDNDVLNHYTKKLSQRESYPRELYKK